jgi:hypothetical protein
MRQPTNAPILEKIAKALTRRLLKDSPGRRLKLMGVQAKRIAKVSARWVVVLGPYLGENGQKSPSDCSRLPTLFERDHRENSRPRSRR